MEEQIILILSGGILGFAHAARNWLAYRMKQGHRCIPKIFLWRGVRNAATALGALAMVVYLGYNASDPPTDPGVRLAVVLFLFVIGVGIGNGLSNLFGGTLSFITEGPYQPGETTNQPSKSKPETDDYGQLKK